MVILEKLGYTTKELVAVTSVNKDYWRMLQRRGVLKPVRLGRKDIWLKKDIEDFLEWAKYNEVSNEFEVIKSLARKDEYEKKRNRRT